MAITNKRLVVCALALGCLVGLSGCIRLLLPTNVEELRIKAKTNVEFVIEREYLDVYRDIMRASKCIDYFAQNTQRSTKNELNREQRVGVVYVQREFDTYILEVEIREKSPTQASVHVWSHYAGDGDPVKKWALGESACSR